jgi:hypothetical protein
MMVRRPVEEMERTGIIWIEEILEAKQMPLTMRKMQGLLYFWKRTGGMLHASRVRLENLGDGLEVWCLRSPSRGRCWGEALAIVSSEWIVAYDQAARQNISSLNISSLINASGIITSKALTFPFSAFSPYLALTSSL